MPHDEISRYDDALLLDVLLGARQIRKYVSGLTEQEFYTNDLVQDAMIRQIQVIGDAVRLMREEAKTRYPTIEWHQIAGMRNRVVHEYFNMRLAIVWKVTQEDIPPLINQLECIVPPEHD
ncbi:DUF86 domain-containing protein [Chloroflexota bacterium]